MSTPTDNTGPIFSSLSIDTTNTELTITFNENAYNTNSGSGDLESSDFSLSVSGGTATSPLAGTITKVSQTVWKMAVTVTGVADGDEILTVNPASNAIFDALGNASSTSLSNNTINLNSKDTNRLDSIYIDGFLDISGGGIETSNNAPLMIAGDASFIGNVFIRPNVIGDSQQILSQTLSSISFPSNPTKTQFGSDIVGASTDYQSGHAVATNGNGDIVAIGEPTNPSGGTNRGKVKVYEKSGSSWSQLGSDIDGTIDQAQFGHSVDLNGDGTTLAVGTKDVSNNALYLYKYDGTTWNQHGNTIHVLSQSDLSFNSHSIAPSINVKLNKEGNKLVTSNKYHVTNTFIGQIQTGTYSAPYSSIGAYHNFEFRRAGVTGSITDDMGGQSITFPGTLDATNGSVISSSQELRSTVTLSHPISVEVYFRLDGGDNGKALFHVNDHLLLTIYNGSIEFGVRLPTGSAYNYYQTPNPFSTNTWYHVAATFYHNMSNAYEQFEIKVYINGSLYGTQMKNLNASDTSRLSGTTTLYMGRGRHTTMKFAGGYRYARVYHKKLSASEITQLYNERDVSTLHGAAIYGDQTFVVEHNEEIVQCYEYSDSSWNQLGNTIESSSTGDLSGGSIDINHEGNTIVVGYPKENNVGSVKVFQYDSSWNQVGGNLVGTETDSMYGHAVTIDGSGDIIGVGIPQHLHSGVSSVLPGNSGFLQKFPQGVSTSNYPFAMWPHNTGNTILSSLSSVNGSDVLKGYFAFDLNDFLSGSNSGSTGGGEGGPGRWFTSTSGSNILKNNYWGDVYFTGNTSTYVGYDENDNTTNYTGSAVILSWSGNYTLKLDTWAIISPDFGIPSGWMLGRDANDNSKYRYLGNGAGGGDKTNQNSPTFGYHTLNSNWEIDQIVWVVASSRFPSGDSTIQVRVYEAFWDGEYVRKDYGKVKMYKNIDNSWNQLGNDIDCETEAERFGSSLAMTASGDVIAVGAPLSNQNYLQKGAVRLYQYSETDSSWNKIGDDIEGEYYYDQIGTSIALNDIGTSLTIGEPNHDTNNVNGINTFKTHIGRTRTFEIEYINNYSYTYGQTLRSIMIGTTEPLTIEDSVLDVSGSTAINGPLHLSGDASFNKLVANDVIVNSIQGRATANSDVDYSDQTTDLSFSTAIRVLTLDNSFNVSSATIHNDLSSNGDVGANFIYDNSLSIAGSLVIVDASNTNYGSYTVYSQKDSEQSFVVGKSKSNVFNIVNQSNVGVYMSDGNNSFTSTSDVKLKENIKTLDDVNEDLLKLNPVHFEWKSQDNDKKQVGFIAQELEKIYPDLVNTNDEQYKTIETNKLIPILLKGIKELKKEIKSLK